MIKYKWCVCDMDGTLLNSQNSISPENERALKELQKEGVKVMVASGRVDLLLKPYLKQLEPEGYVISCNGALIRDTRTMETVYSHTMDGKAASNIVNHCKECGIDYFVYTADFVYSNKNNPRALRYENSNKELSRELQFPIRYLETGTEEELKDLEILKVLLICKDQQQVFSMQTVFSDFSDITAVSSASGLLDIMASHTSKGRALKTLAEQNGVGMEEIIAFGDNYNDMDMLEQAGLPIAMDNSVEELKRIAKYVTKSNDESGIAYAIRHYILN